MAVITGESSMYSRWNEYDAYLYDKILGDDPWKIIKKGRDFVGGTETLPGAIGRSLIPGMRHAFMGAREATGLGYIGAGVKHYATVGSNMGTRARLPSGKYGANRSGHTARMMTAAMGPNEWEKYFISSQSIYGKAGVQAGRGHAMMRAGMVRGKSALGVMMRGIAPAFALYGATESRHGFGIGLVGEIAGFSAWGVGSSLGAQLGGWAGGTGVSAAASGLAKIPGVRKIATTAIAQTTGKIAGVAGTLLGGPIGWLIGGLAAWETAKWGVGLALSSLPTFAKQFQSDMSISGYGGDYTESAGAITMRQRSLQAMGKSFVNARSALGQEGALLHA